MSVERTHTLSLWCVRLRGQKRVHYVAQILEQGMGIFYESTAAWSAPTTVCGRTGWAGDLGERLKFCGACRDGAKQAWDSAPPEILKQTAMGGLR